MNIIIHKLIKNVAVRVKVTKCVYSKGRLLVYQRNIQYGIDDNLYCNNNIITSILKYQEVQKKKLFYSRTH